MCDLPVKTITLGGGKQVLVDGDYDGEYLSTHFRWYWNARIKRVTGHCIGRGRVSLYLGRIASGCPLHLWVEYKNGDVLDNRSCNIQWATPSQTMAKRSRGSRKPLSRSKITGYYGVTESRGGSHTVPHYNAMYRGTYLGGSYDPKIAARKYNDYVLRMGYDDPLNDLD